MASKFIVFCAFLAVARAGNLLAPQAYSAAPAVSTVYSSISSPAKAVSYAAPAVAAVHAAPAVSAVHAAPFARYSPATAVSTSYSSIAAAPVAYAAPVAKTLTYAAPAHTVALHTPAIGSSSQNIIRSFDGTVSQHAKAVDTAFSSVRKIDTRVNNNVYTPAIAKTLAYAAPAQTIVTSHAAPAIYAARAAYAAPAAYAAHTTYAAPAAYSAHAAYAAPAHYAAPTHYAAPAVYAAPAHYAAQAHYGAPAHYAAPAEYSTKTVSFSPASSVAHVSFEGYGANYAW